MSVCETRIKLENSPEHFRGSLVQRSMVASRHYILLALALSLALHAWLAAVWTGPSFNRVPQAEILTGPNFTLDISPSRRPEERVAPAPPPLPAIDEAAPSEGMEIQQENGSEEVEDSNDQAPATPSSTPLNMNLEGILGEEPKADSRARRVFDPKLAERIASSRTQPRRVSRDRFESEFASNRTVGGEQASFFRVDDLCFEVVAANPLEPLSMERWYRVDCGD